MIGFHLTEIKNLPSILKDGLIGRRPSLDHHLTRFQEDGLKGDKVVYTYGFSSKMDKYAKDMVYYKQWIKPRNAIAYKYDQYNFAKGCPTFFKNERYVLLCVDTKGKDENFFNTYTHSQTATNNPLDPLFGMDSEFEHDDKQLIMFANHVKPEYITPIMLYDCEIEKRNKFRITSRVIVQSG